jgi:hypothetical protein
MSSSQGWPAGPRAISWTALQMPCWRGLTLLHLPPLRFRCVGGCWDWTQEICFHLFCAGLWMSFWADQQWARNTVWVTLYGLYVLREPGKSSCIDLFETWNILESENNKKSAAQLEGEQNLAYWGLKETASFDFCFCYFFVQLQPHFRCQHFKL